MRSQQDNEKKVDTNRTIKDVVISINPRAFLPETAIFEAVNFDIDLMKPITLRMVKKIKTDSKTIYICEVQFADKATDTIMVTDLTNRQSGPELTNYLKIQSLKQKYEKGELSADFLWGLDEEFATKLVHYANKHWQQNKHGYECFIVDLLCEVKHARNRLIKQDSELAFLIEKSNACIDFLIHHINKPKPFGTSPLMEQINTSYQISKVVDIIQIIMATPIVWICHYPLAKALKSQELLTEENWYYLCKIKDSTLLMELVDEIATTPFNTEKRQSVFFELINKYIIRDQTMLSLCAADDREKSVKHLNVAATKFFEDTLFDKNILLMIRETLFGNHPPHFKKQQFKSNNDVTSYDPPVLKNL